MINSKGEEYLVLGQEKAKFSFKDVSLTGKDLNAKKKYVLFIFMTVKRFQSAWIKPGFYKSLNNPICFIITVQSFVLRLMQVKSFHWPYYVLSNYSNFNYVTGKAKSILSLQAASVFSQPSKGLR
jgi:hypothetical protein